MREGRCQGISEYRPGVQTPGLWTRLCPRGGEHADRQPAFGELHTSLTFPACRNTFGVWFVG